jgi:hypothetical protein
MKKMMILPALAALLLASASAYSQDSKPAEPTPAKAEATQQTASETAAKEADESAVAPKEDFAQEALDAVGGTQGAIAALEDGDAKEALDVLATVAGKLEILVARAPEIGVLPVARESRVIEIIADAKAIDAMVDAAKDALDDGDVQVARHILKDAASEVVISTTSLPIDTFPAEITAVVPLIDAGKLDEARDGLVAALGSLIVTEEIIPLPPLRAAAMLDRAEKLAENESRTDRESADLAELLASARGQLKVAEALGYGDKDAYESIYKEISTIEEKTRDKKGGKGWFATVKDKLSNLVK